MFVYTLKNTMTTVFYANVFSAEITQVKTKGAHHLKKKMIKTKWESLKLDSTNRLCVKPRLLSLILGLL